MEKTYIVEGMSCNGCASAVENAIKDYYPTATVRIDLQTQRVTVKGMGDDAEVQKAVENAGYTYRGVA